MFFKKKKKMVSYVSTEKTFAAVNWEWDGHNLTMVILREISLVALCFILLVIY